MAFDVSKVRAAYPALADGYAYLDGAAGTQLPASVIDAIGDAYRAGLGNAGGAFPASQRSDAVTAECRAALADLTGGQPDGVILGPNMTTLTYRLAALPGRLAGALVMRSSSPGLIMTRTCGPGCRPPPGPALRCAGLRSTRPPVTCTRRSSAS